MPGAGRPFEKGHKKLEGAGRVKGTPNKRTVFVQKLLEDAVVELGGLKALLAWVQKAPENEFAFWTQMVMKLLPVQILGSGKDGEMVLTVKRDELNQKLEERGIPPILFGADVPEDVPLLDLKPYWGPNQQSEGQNAQTG